MPPVQSTFAVQKVHVATGMLLLTANNSTVQPLAPPLYVTQEILHRHILGGAKAHGIEDQLGAGGGILKLAPVPVTCKRVKCRHLVSSLHFQKYANSFHSF